MFKDGVPIGRLFGISIRLHYSWFVIFALSTYALAADYFPSVYPQWGTPVAVTAGILTSLLFFASLLAHEMMHSLVAQRYGIPVRAITLFIFGGVSQITEEPHEARTEFRIAVAGPLTSVVLGIIFLSMYYFLPPALDVVAAISFWLGWINIVLAVFNMVPGFPLDGGRVLRSIIWWRTGNLRTATRWASNFGRAIGFLMIFGGVWMVFKGEWSTGIWLGLIGWFLASTAARSFNQIAVQQALEGHIVSDLDGGDSDCASVAPDISIERLVNDYIVPTGRRCFVVMKEGITLGLVSLQEVKGVLRDMRPRIVVSQIMKPVDKLQRVAPDEDLLTVLNILTNDNLTQVPVMVDDRMVGLVTRDNLLTYIKQQGRKSL